MGECDVDGFVEPGLELCVGLEEVVGGVDGVDEVGEEGGECAVDEDASS